MTEPSGVCTSGLQTPAAAAAAAVAALVLRRDAVELPSH